MMKHGVDVRKLSVGPMDNNVHIVLDQDSREGLVIDPANDAARILEAVDGLHITSILLTHGHADHIQALEALRSALSVPVGIHLADAAMLPIAPDFAITDGQEIGVGRSSLVALHTPGHTPGSTCFYTPGYLFSGDTLFPGGPGNTWGNRALFDEIIGSIRNKLFVLPDDTQVLPGHGADTYIGDERPLLPDWIARGW